MLTRLGALGVGVGDPLPALTVLLTGFVLGFVGSMPVFGPIGSLVIGRGLQGRFTAGAMIGIGGAVPESGYACLAFLGFGTMLASHVWIEPLSRGIAALLALGVGVHLTSRPAPTRAPVAALPPEGMLRSFLVGVVVSASNLTLVANWGAAVTTLHSFDIVSFNTECALPFSVGAGLGIAGWCLVLVALLRRLRARIRPGTAVRLSRAAGALLIALGLVLAARFVLWTA